LREERRAKGPCAFFTEVRKIPHPAWKIAHRPAAEGVEIVEVSTFDEAEKSLRINPPDAVIAHVGPAALPGREFTE
jgi:hypothetical protein